MAGRHSKQGRLQGTGRQSCLHSTSSMLQQCRSAQALHTSSLQSLGNREWVHQRVKAPLWLKQKVINVTTEQRQNTTTTTNAQLQQKNSSINNTRRHHQHECNGITRNVASPEFHQVSQKNGSSMVNRLAP